MEIYPYQILILCGYSLIHAYKISELIFKNFKNIYRIFIGYSIERHWYLYDTSYIRILERKKNMKRKKGETILWEFSQDVYDSLSFNDPDLKFFFYEWR